MRRLLCPLLGHRWRYVRQFLIPRPERDLEGKQCVRCLRIKWDAEAV